MADPIQDSERSPFVNLRSHRCRGCGGFVADRKGNGGANMSGGIAPDRRGTLCLPCWRIAYPPARSPNAPYTVNANWERECQLRGRGSVVARRSA